MDGHLQTEHKKNKIVRIAVRNVLQTNENNDG